MRPLHSSATSPLRLALIALAASVAGVTSLETRGPVSTAAQQSARDPSPANAGPRGTARLTGRVVALDSGRPVKRARVVVSGSGLTPPRTAFADDTGGYQISELPAGAVVVTASKDAFLAGAYGQASWPGSGTPIVLADGQALDGVEIRLARGGVVTGHVFDEGGEPVVGATVRVSRLVWMAGDSRMTPGGVDTSDDRGEYRVFGLQPGTYYVAATAKNDSLPLRGGPAAPGRAGGTPLAYGPTYYPSAGNIAAATAVRVRAGQETQAIDVSTRLVPVAEVNGTVALGERTGRVSVSLLPDEDGPRMLPGMEATVAQDGTFRFADVPQGRYLALAREVGGMGRGAGAVPRPRFAVQRLLVVGDSTTTIAMTLGAGGTVAGRVTFEPSAGALPSPTSIRVLTTGPPSAAGLPPSVTTARPDGTFLLESVPPLPFLLEAVHSVAPGTATRRAVWALKGLYLNGREISDTPLRVSPGETVTGVVVVFSDRVSALTGVVHDARGEAVPGCAVLAFSTDPTLWRVPQSRYLRMVRTDPDGHFEIRPLPPGEYHVHALVGIDALEWSNPDVLERLRDGATRVTLSGDGTRTVELRPTERWRP
jgi:hypothetical protein